MTCLFLTLSSLYSRCRPQVLNYLVLFVYFGFAEGTLSEPILFGWVYVVVFNEVAHNVQIAMSGGNENWACVAVLESCLWVDAFVLDQILYNVKTAVFCRQKN